MGSRAIGKKEKILIFILVLSLLVLCALQYLTTKISIAFTIKGQECFPFKVWLIKKGVIPERGEYVAFKNPKVDGRATWIKIISGKEGDRIEVIKLSEIERFKVFIDELGKELPVRGFVILYSTDPLYNLLVLEVFERDTRGRELPMIEEGRIPPQKYFVTSPAIRSYDSRYWGLVDESNIIGKAYPLF